jgi:hypothetical protein
VSLRILPEAVHFAEMGICVVCQENFNDAPNDIVKISTCEHMFHRRCIIGWAESISPQRDTCPSCRTLVYQREPLTENEIAQLEEELEEDEEEDMQFEYQSSDENRFSHVIRFSVPPTHSTLTAFGPSFVESRDHLTQQVFQEEINRMNNTSPTSPPIFVYRTETENRVDRSDSQMLEYLYPQYTPHQAPDFSVYAPSSTYRLQSQTSARHLARLYDLQKLISDFHGISEEIPGVVLITRSATRHTVYSSMGLRVRVEGPDGFVLVGNTAIFYLL